MQYLWLVYLRIRKKFLQIHLSHHGATIAEVHRMVNDLALIHMQIKVLEQERK